MHHPRAAAAARFYLSLGWQPLPSRASGRKMPALGGYAEFRDGEPIPERWLEHWWTPNVQLCCGVRWGLAAVDLDGGAGKARWRAWARERGAPKTWAVRSGGGGLHLWFTLPGGIKECATRKVWGSYDSAANAWREHCYVELMGDLSLIVAPPSRHVKTGREYRFLPGFAPADLPRPAELPAWVLSAPALATPGAPAPAPRPPQLVPRAAGRLDRRAVLDAMTAADKLAWAARCGLRLVGGPNGKGWVACRALGREDRNPSAGFNVNTGYYSEAGDARMSLFDLAVDAGLYATWQEACDAMGRGLV